MLVMTAPSSQSALLAPIILRQHVAVRNAKAEILA
jgi:hypothetical protein